MIIKWIIIFTLVFPDGSIRSNVVQQSAETLDSCKQGEQWAEQEILRGIQSGEVKNGFAICKLIKVRLPSMKGA